MSIANILSQNGYSIYANNLIVTNEINVGDIIVQNVQITNNLGVDGDTAIKGELQLASNISPLANLLGTNNQVLSMGLNNTLKWQTNAPDGVQGITTNNTPLVVISGTETVNINLNLASGIIGTGSQILVTPTGIIGNVTLSVPNNLIVSTSVTSGAINVLDHLAVGGNTGYVFPSVSGTQGESLVVALSGSPSLLGWLQTGGGFDITGITSSNSAILSTSNVNIVTLTPKMMGAVFGTTNQIVVSDNLNGTVKLSLSSIVDVTDMNVADEFSIGVNLTRYQFPLAIGSSSQILSVDPINANMLKFTTPIDTGITSIVSANTNILSVSGTTTTTLTPNLLSGISGTTNQIVVSDNLNGAVKLSLPSTVDLTDLNVADQLIIGSTILTK